MAITTEQIIAVSPSHREVVTQENLADLSHKHAHPATEASALTPGDVIWRVPTSGGGGHLVVIWVASQRGGFGRNGMGAEGWHEGVIEIRDGGVPTLVTEAGRLFDLAQGTEIYPAP